MILKSTFYNRPTIKVARELLGCYLVRKTPNGIMIGKITETESYCGPKDKANHASKGLTPRTAPMFGKCGHSYIYLIYGMYNCLNIVTEKEGYPAAVLIRSIEPIKGIDLMIKNRNFKFFPLSQPCVAKGSAGHASPEAMLAARGARGAGGFSALPQSPERDYGARRDQQPPFSITTNKIKTLTNGPGKLCQALCLTKNQNNLNITNKKNNLWIETPPEKNNPPSASRRRGKIKKGPRVGIDYAEEYKDKLWRVWI